MFSHTHLDFLFEPASILVAGASTIPGKVGYALLENILNAGFTGKIYPVNPKGGNVLALPIFRKVADVPEPVDLAVICVPAPIVPEILQALGEKGTKACVILSAGFKETGRQGRCAEDALKQLADKYNITLLGPNCFGIINPARKLNASFSNKMPRAGNISLFSQSGAFCAPMLEWLQTKKLGVSSFVSLGNKARIDATSLLDRMADDPATRVIAGYLESIENGSRFLRTAQIASRKKPIIIFRAGRTASGAKAVSSHTGSLAGEDIAYAAAFRQTGILRAESMEELFQLTEAFSKQPLPAGPGLAILSNAGGPAIVAADACEQAGLTLAHFSAATTAALQALLPSYAATHNPVDVGGDSTPEIIAEAVRIILQDAAVHSFLLLVAPSTKAAVADIVQGLPAVIEQQEQKKTFFACFLDMKQSPAVQEFTESMSIPSFPFPEPAIQAIQAMHRYQVWLEKSIPVEIAYRRDTGRVRDIITAARATNTLELAEFQAQGMLAAYELATPPTKLARVSDEAVNIAKNIGFPVALKIASPQVVHKSDVGGIILNLADPEAVQQAFTSLTRKFSALHGQTHISGCLVQGMAPANAREVIIGFRREAPFGALVMFGLGGVHTAIFKDIACRLVPLGLEDVKDMIYEIKAFPLLAGSHGQKAINFTALEDVIIIMSQLAQDFPDIQEAEFNPVFITENEALVGDIRVILSAPPSSALHNTPPTECTVTTTLSDTTEA